MNKRRWTFSTQTLFVATLCVAFFCSGWIARGHRVAQLKTIESLRYHEAVSQRINKEFENDIKNTMKSVREVEITNRDDGKLVIAVDEVQHTDMTLIADILRTRAAKRYAKYSASDILVVRERDGKSF